MIIAMMEIAAAKPSSPPSSLMNSLKMVTGKVLNPSPISMGVPKSASDFINTSSPPAKRVGRIRGTTMILNRRNPEQPRLSLASRRELSTFFSAPVA